MIPNQPQPSPMQPPSPMAAGAAPVPNAGGGQSFDKYQQQIMQICQQSLTPEDQQVLAAALTPDLMGVLSKLFGDQRVQYVGAPIVAAVSQYAGDYDFDGGDASGEVPGEMAPMVSPDQMGGTPGPMPDENGMIRRSSLSGLVAG